MATIPIVDEPDSNRQPLAEAADHREVALLRDQLSKSAEDLRMANARLRALIDIGLDFSSPDQPARLQRLCQAVKDLFGADYVTAGLVGRHCLLGRLVTAGIDGPPWLGDGDALTGIFATVVSHRRPIRGVASVDDPEERSFPIEHPPVREFLIGPISSPTHVCGWICLVRNEGPAFTPEEESQLLALAGHVGRLHQLEHEASERHLAEAALRNSDRLTRNLLEHLPHRILVKDRQSIMRFCNANYARDLGVPVDQVIGKSAAAFHPPAQAEAYDADDREVMETGVSKNVEEAYEIDGVKRWVRTIKVPYRDEKDQVTGVLAVFEDITERRLMEQQFQQAQKMEAVGQLAGSIAHDFNNLLTAILGYCEMLLDDESPPSDPREDILQIQHAGARAAALTRQLLAFSRKEIIAPAILDLNRVVTDMRPMLDRLIREDVSIVFRLEPHLGCVLADRGQVEQMVLNLALNARDAMPTGGRLTIETANTDLTKQYALSHPMVTAGPHVCVSVTDTGHGMTPSIQARLFEPFFTTKTAGKGTGLGLASVQGTMARSGGSIAVVSEPDKGAVFTAYFPRTEDAPLSAATAPAVVAKPRGTETILVVEDEQGLRALVRAILSRQGYTVLLAANTDEARRLFDENVDIKLLLTDVVMPGVSGPDLARELVAKRPDLKVVYMSGYTDGSIVQHGVLRPGIALIAKPFTALTLGLKIRSVLEAGSEPF